MHVQGLIAQPLAALTLGNPLRGAKLQKEHSNERRYIACSNGLVNPLTRGLGIRELEYLITQKENIHENA